MPAPRQAIKRLADALATSGVDIMPRVQIVIGEAGGEVGNAPQALIGMLLSEKGATSLDGPVGEGTNFTRRKRNLTTDSDGPVDTAS